MITSLNLVNTVIPKQSNASLVSALCKSNVLSIIKKTFNITDEETLKDNNQNYLMGYV